MNRILSNILLALTMAMCAPLASCVLEYPDSGNETGEAILAVTVGPIDGSTRASEDVAVPACEKINNIRLLVLDKDGNLEINRNFLTPAQDQGYTFRIFGVSPKGGKKIFAIANDGSTGLADSDGSPIAEWGKGKGGVEEILKKHSFVPAYSDSEPIPHFGEEAIAGDLVPGEATRVDINLVRIATKFDVKVINERGELVRITDFSINGLADKTFLTPHFNRENAEPTTIPANENAGIIRKTKGKDKFLSFKSPGLPETNASEIHWAEWMKYAVEESQDNPKDESLADMRGWIMEYAIPADASHSTKPWIPAGDTRFTMEKNKSVSLPAHYYPESKMLLGAVKPESWRELHKDANGLEQGYSYDITFQSLNDDGSEKGVPKTFSGLPFKNLRALFRNTHVTLEITIKKAALEWKVYTRPWYQRIQPEIIM